MNPAPTGVLGRWHRRHPVLAALIVLGLCTGRATARGDDQPARPLPKDRAELLTTTAVWNLHLTFAPDQWTALEPKGGPGSGPGGPGAFGPGMFLAPAFLGASDQDRDGKVSKAEFHALGEKWFGEWDKDKAGRLNNDQLKAGLNAAFTPPAGFGGPPGAGGPRPPGPGIMLRGPEGKRNGLASAIGLEFQHVHADLAFEGQAVKDVGVRYKGNGTFMQSMGQLKRSLKIDLGHYVKGQNLAGVSTLNLHSNVTDASWMNEVLSHRLYRDAGVPAPRTAFARAYLTVPGKFDRQYVGLYSVVENVDQEFAAARFGGRRDGALFKPVTPEPFADMGDDWAKYKQTYDPKGEVTPEQTGRVIALAKLMNVADDAMFAAKVGDYVDLDEFARYMAVTVWLSTMDSILGVGQNYYVYLHPETHKFQFIPWDLDHSFGQFFLMGSQEQREALSIDKPWNGQNRFLERVFKVDAFKKLYRARLEEFSRTIFDPARLAAQVDEVAAAIRPAVAAESAQKLERFDAVVAGKPVSPAPMGGPPGGGPGGPGPQPGGAPGGPGFGGGPPPFAMPAVKPIKGFVFARAESVRDQLAGKSKGETLDGGFGIRPGGPPPGPGGPGERGGNVVIGPGGRGGPGGPGGRDGPGGGPPEGFGPGMFLGPAFMAAFDADKNGQLTRDELVGGMDKWFAGWDADHSGQLTSDQLRKGIDREFNPFRGGGPPGGPGSGPPPQPTPQPRPGNP